MGETAQTIRLVECELLGLSATIEKHSEVTRRRSTPGQKIVPQDGRNREITILDPAAGFEPVTLELNPKKSAVFLDEAQRMFDEQLDDPNAATALVIRSYVGRVGIAATAVAIKASIYSISTPPGDKNSHALATAKIVVEIEDFVTSRR
jgi:hypothetical protein